MNHRFGDVVPHAMRRLLLLQRGEALLERAQYARLIRDGFAPLADEQFQASNLSNRIVLHTFRYVTPFILSSEGKVSEDLREEFEEPERTFAGEKTR